MNFELTERQACYQGEFRGFVAQALQPYAEQFDQGGQLAPAFIRQLAEQKYLGAMLPKELGGLALDLIEFGLLCEEVGRACSSTRSLLTVHSMVVQAIQRWGNEETKAHWLPKLATGETIGAFALSEPDAGSDIEGLATAAVADGDDYVLNGTKKWITFGQLADLFLIFAKCDQKPVAFVVECDSPGLATEPIENMLGIRATQTARLSLTDVRVPKVNMIGGLGFGLMAVALSALHLGRYSVAWGCVGMGQACINASVRYAATRRQFGKELHNHQLIQQMLTNMIVNVQAARLLCYQAGHEGMTNPRDAVQATLIAKYFASTMASRVTSDAVQIHGANGCSEDSQLQRLFRDAKIMEIIEGSTQLQQIMIAQNAQVA